MHHLQIALAIWGALGVGLLVIFIAAMGKAFGYTTVIGGLLTVTLVYGGGTALVAYTGWAIYGAVAR